MKPDYFPKVYHWFVTFMSICSLLTYQPTVTVKVLVKNIIYTKYKNIVFIFNEERLISDPQVFFIKWQIYNIVTKNNWCIAAKTT